MVVMAVGAAAYAQPKATPKRPVSPSGVPSSVSTVNRAKEEQARVGPALQQMPYQKAVEALRSGRGPQVSPEQSRILSVTINDGALVKCGDSLRIKVRVLGGPKTPGLHWLSLARTTDSTILPYKPPTNPSPDTQVGTELTMSVGEQREVTLEPDWKVRCTGVTGPMNGLFGGVFPPGYPEVFVISLTPPYQPHAGVEVIPHTLFVVPSERAFQYVARTQ